MTGYWEAFPRQGNLIWMSYELMSNTRFALANNSCTHLFYCFDLKNIQPASTIEWPFWGICPSLKYPNHAMWNSWWVMLNNGAMTEIKLKTFYCSLLLVQKSNHLYLWEKVRAGLCDVDCYLVILRLGLNVNVLFCVALCAYTFPPAAHSPSGTLEESELKCRQ